MIIDEYFIENYIVLLIHQINNFLNIMLSKLYQSIIIYAN